MKILIAYATKTGTTKDCAVRLSALFPTHETFLCDLAESNPSPDDYDFVVIGGSIRMGKLDKRVKDYIKRSEAKLKNAKTAFFICNGFSEETENYFEKNFPSELLKKAAVFSSFGGELKSDRQRGLDKVIVKLLLEANSSNDEFILPTISTEEIGRFADRIKECAF